jgi:hypothetical protein
MSVPGQRAAEVLDKGFLSFTSKQQPDPAYLCLFYKVRVPNGNPGCTPESQSEQELESFLTKQLERLPWMYIVDSQGTKVYNPGSYA